MTIWLDRIIPMRLLLSAGSGAPKKCRCSGAIRTLLTGEAVAEPARDEGLDAVGAGRLPRG